MNDIQIFNSPDFGDIRTMTIDGDAWFVGKDVADALGYSNASKAVMIHVDDEDKQFMMLTSSDSQNGNLVKTALINESGLYSLILSSKLPGAKKFKRWVTGDVLPSLRKTGQYMTHSDQRSLTPDDYIKAASIISTCKDDRLYCARRLLEQAGIDASLLKIEPEPELIKDELQRDVCVGFWTVTDASKYIGLPYRNVAEFLIRNGVICRGGKRGVLLPTRKGEESHLATRFRRMTCNAERAGYREKQTYLTQKGILYLLNYKDSILSGSK